MRPIVFTAEAAEAAEELLYFFLRDSRLIPSASRNAWKLIKSPRSMLESLRYLKSCAS
jgi:hypothetical protein